MVEHSSELKLLSDLRSEVNSLRRRIVVSNFLIFLVVVAMAAAAGLGRPSDALDAEIVRAEGVRLYAGQASSFSSMDTRSVVLSSPANELTLSLGKPGLTLVDKGSGIAFSIAVEGGELVVTKTKEGRITSTNVLTGGAK